MRGHTLEKKTNNKTFVGSPLKKVKEEFRYKKRNFENRSIRSKEKKNMQTNSIAVVSSRLKKSPPARPTGGGRFRN